MVAAEGVARLARARARLTEEDSMTCGETSTFVPSSSRFRALMPS